MPTNLARVLLVDDQRENIAALVAMLRPEGHLIQVALSGEQALVGIVEDPPDLIILDANLAGTNCFHFIRRLKANPASMTIPVILLTEQGNRSFELLGRSAGAEEILEQPVDRFELAVRVRNLLRLKHHSNALSMRKRVLEQQVKGHSASLRDSYLETIFALTRASSFRDQETGAHVKRISYYCAHLATALGLDVSFVDSIFYASPLHDIGKIGIPDDILLKPGAHTPDEAAIMRRHTVIGAEILGSSGSPYLAMGAEIALRHHERWDGTGYPDQLAGEAIPLAARIMAVCDVYDALRSRRPYKSPMSHVDAVRVIMSGDERTRPEHFDPEVLNTFVRSAARVNEIFEEHADEDVPSELPPASIRRY